MHPSRNVRFHRKTLFRLFLLIVLTALAAAVFNAAGYKDVTIVVDGEEHSVSTKARSVAQLLNEEGIYLRSGDILSEEPEAGVVSGQILELHRAIPVFLHYDGKMQLVYTSSVNVGELLDEFDVVAGPLDRVVPDAGNLLQKGEKVKVIRVKSVLHEEEVFVPFKTVKKEDPAIFFC